MPLKKSLKIIFPESGFIMLHTMMVVFVLAVFALIFGRAVRHFEREGAAQTFQIEFKTLSYSKIYEAIFKISQDGPLADHLKDIWNIKDKIDSNHLITVEDESGKINLLGLKSKEADYQKRVEKSIRRLLDAKEVPVRIIESMIEEVKKGNGVASLEALESYATAGRENQAYLNRFLTVHSDGKININTAPSEVLEVLLEEENLLLVKEILSKRGKEPFLDLKQFEDLEDSTRAFLSVNSTFFTIKIANQYHRVFFKVVIHRSLGATKIVEWIEK
jgi:type II secretory pathway component PulK